MDSNINPEYQAGLNLKLIDAAGLGNIDQMAALLNEGAEINGFARSITALMSAASKGQLAAVEFLCMNKADLNIVSLQAQNTALIYAVIDGHIDVVNYLVYVGAKLDCQNMYGSTAFMRAYRREDKSAAFNLLCAMSMENIMDIQATNRFDLVTQPCKAFIIKNQQKILEILHIFEEPECSLKGLFLTLPIEVMAKIFHESALFGECPYTFRLIEDLGYVLNQGKTMDFLPLEKGGEKRKAEDNDFQSDHKKYQKTERGERNTKNLTQKNKLGK